MDKRLEEGLQHIRNWLVEQPHLKVSETEDRFILNFLRGCKFSRQKTKEKLDLFYTLRLLVPEYFTNRDPLLADIQEFLKQRNILLLQSPDVSTPKSILIRTKNINPDKFNIGTIIKILLMILDVLLLKDCSFTLQLVIDLQRIPHKCIMQLTPSVFKKLILILQKAYPFKINGIHLIHVPECFKPVLSILKVYISKKIRDRIHFYTNDEMDIVHKHVPVSMITCEYDGEGGYIDEMADKLKLELKLHKNWLLKNGLDYSAETKWPEKPKTFSDIFGMDSSTKLDLDYQEYVILCRQKYKDFN